MRSDFEAVRKMLSDPANDRFRDEYEEKAVQWVDWREELDSICCVIPEDDKRFEFVYNELDSKPWAEITLKKPGRTVEVDFIPDSSHEYNHQYDTLKAVAEFAYPEYIVLCDRNYRGDTWAVVTLTSEEYNSLISEFGAETVGKTLTRDIWE